MKYWLDIASKKIRMNPEFDGDLIIFIDHINLIRDGDKNIENNLKFWIPQQTP